MHSENPVFHFDPRLELNLCFALGDSYHRMGRYEEAKEVLEEAWRVCKQKNIKESARVAGKLGWIYQ